MSTKTPTTTDPVRAAIIERLDRLGFDVMYLDYVLRDGGAEVPPMLLCRAGVTIDRLASELEQLAGIVESTTKTPRDR